MMTTKKLMKKYLEEAVKDRNHVQHEYIKFSNTGAFSSLEEY